MGATWLIPLSDGEARRCRQNPALVFAHAGVQARGDDTTAAHGVQKTTI
jgi:hypothetical protein